MVSRCQKLILTIVLFWLTVQPVYGLEVADVTQPLPLNSNWIADTAEVIDSDIETWINQFISLLKADKDEQIYVVTVPQIPKNTTYREFATALLFAWQVDRFDNSVVMLVVMGDRHIEIKTGNMISNIISDSLLKKIIDETIVPEFKQGNFSQGIFLGTQQIVRYLEHPYSANRTKSANLVAILVLICIIFVYIVIPLFFIIVFLLNKIFPKALSDRATNSSDTGSFSSYSDFGGGGDSGDSGGGAGGDW